MIRTKATCSDESLRSPFQRDVTDLASARVIIVLLLLYSLETFKWSSFSVLFVSKKATGRGQVLKRFRRHHSCFRLLKKFIENTSLCCGLFVAESPCRIDTRVLDWHIYENYKMHIECHRTHPRPYL
jgi:hypothetical protein